MRKSMLCLGAVAIAALALAACHKTKDADLASAASAESAAPAAVVASDASAAPAASAAPSDSAAPSSNRAAHRGDPTRQ